MDKKPNYGIDAPGVVQSLFAISLGVILFFQFILYYRYVESTFWIDIIQFCVRAIPLCCLPIALLMVWSSKIGKIRQASKILDNIYLRGNEKVLDVGCGRGLFSIEVARRLSYEGHVTGIDIWNSSDLTGNTMQSALDNVELEGFSGMIDIVDGNACDLSFVDESFDVVVSSFVIHNIVNMEDRFVALDEMLRVLKPGGHLIIQDIFCTQEYFQYFSYCEDVAKMTLSGLQWSVFPPSRILIIQKAEVLLDNPEI